MDSIQDFVLDNWIREFGPKCHTSLSSSAAPVISINALRDLADPAAKEVLDADLPLDYGPFYGSKQLRQLIADLHSTPESPLTIDNVVITPGSIMANYLLLSTMCKKGDHVICQYPAYQQLFLLPRQSGVDVTLWAASATNDWLPDVTELQRLLKPNTKAIIINNPNNPSGAALPRALLEKIIAIAREKSITVFCDEVFAPLYYTTGAIPPPIVTLGYENSISTGSLSKAYGLPGIRVGWVVSRSEELMRKVKVARDYTTISVSRLDDAVATFALGPDVRMNLLKRNLDLCKECIGLVDDFVKRNKRCRWMQPQGGAIGFVQILDHQGQPVDDAAFGAQFAEDQGVLLVPGRKCFGENGTQDFKGYFRVSLGEPSRLRKALPLLEKFLTQDSSK